MDQQEFLDAHRNLQQLIGEYDAVNDAAGQEDDAQSGLTAGELVYGRVF